MSERESPAHECRQAKRCRARIRDTEGVDHGVGVERPGSLCRACENAAFAAIRQLDQDWTALRRAVIEPRGRIPGDKVSGTAGRPIPIPLDVDTLATDIEIETLRWAIRLTRGDPLPTSRQACVLRCVAIVGSRLGTLVDLPAHTVTVFAPRPDGGDDLEDIVLDGVDAVLRLAALHDRTQSVLGLVEMTTWLQECCHVCGKRTLTADVKDDTVHCRNSECQAVWAHAEFVRLSSPLELMTA